MTDDAAPSLNPFDQYDPDKSGTLPAAEEDQDNPFAQYGPKPVPSGSSTTGAFARGAERGALPAIGGLAAAGAGAEIGAAAGAFGGPAAPITVPAGALIGGIAGALGGGYAVSKAQDWLLSKAPDSWREAIGQDERQQQLDEAQHPYASFLGGLAPYALTMRPGAVSKVALPENATALQRIMANPVTARVFGGAAMGGMELGQEAAAGQSPDWTKLAISTGAGLVFNKPTRFGEAITEIGARPARGLVARETAPAAVPEKPEPTLAQAGDVKVAGPGVTEAVFHGSHEQSESAALTAQDAARTEQAITGESAADHDVHQVARQMHPELFDQYDALSARRDTFRRWIEEFHNPPDEAFEGLAGQKADLEERLAAVPTSGAGRNLAEARRLRAQIRDLDSQVQRLNDRRTAFTEGRAEETPELTAARQQLLATDFEMRDLAPQVSAAYRRTADAIGAGTVPAPEAATNIPENIPAAPETTVKTTAEFDRQFVDQAAPARSIAEQKAIIGNDVARKLIAAGRPEEEATAAGHLLAERYATRAARFNGALGTAEELYGREGPVIRGSGPAAAAASPSLAPTAPPALPAAQAPPSPVHAQSIRPVEAAYEATDRINALTPVEQKRELPRYTPDADTGTASPKGEDQPAGVFMFDPLALNVDAGRFQFKSGGDEYGVTNALKGVTKWDASKAQAIIVWEQKDGKLFVADGHQRAGLAMRLTEQGNAKDIQLPGILYREADGIAADDAKAIAALTNIANGSGSALDGAKIIRARPDLMDGSVPLSAGKGQQAAALAKLGDEPFRMVVNEVVPENYGAIVGDLIPRDHDRQLAAMKAIARFEPKNIDEAAALTQRVAQAELAKAEEGKQISMFGDLETPESTAGEEMKIVGAAIRSLAKDKSLFSRVVANAERIEQTGSHIERAAAQSIKTDAEIFAKTLASDAYAAGPLRTELVAAAKDLKDGKGSIADATGRVIAAIRRQAEENGLGRPGDLGRVEQSADEAKELFQRKQSEEGPLFEPGAEGLPQQLVPGVAPITERDRIMAAAAKPLAPKRAQKDMPAEGLFGDSHLQQELFQSARGKIRLSPDARPVITLMKDANASTFIHETGHQWLEELMRDAEHPAAPDIVKDDATTVRDWLGVDSADDIKTRHHEKFARGFEQYMREGVAPSPGLAGVFQKFKTWLTTIYQTLKGLGKEISPDIRDVFDRMIATEPQRTVIAPERPGGPTLADIHEADAAEVEPHEAESAADRVAAERARYIQEPPPEIEHEIAPVLAEAEAARQAEGGSEPGAGAEPGAEVGGGARGSTEVVDRGGDGGPQPPSGGVGTGRGEVGGSGGEAKTEGPSVPGAAERRGAAEGSESSLSPNPAPLFGPRESPFVDKAGNIRLENLTSREDVAKAIRDAAEENEEFIGDRRGTVTDGQVMDLADALGMDAAQLSQRKIGQAFNAEQIIAARKLLVQSAADVSETMKRAAAGTDEDVMAYAMAKDRHQMIQGQVAGITAEAGRALRAFRSIAGQEEAQGIDQFLRSATGKTLFQLREEAKLGAQLDSPAKVSKFLADAQKRTFGRMILEYWVNGLISGPMTHATYAVGNQALAIMKAVPETAAAALVGSIRTQLTGGTERVRLGETWAQMKARSAALPAALEAAAEALRSGQTTLLPGEQARPLIPFQGDTALTIAKNTTNEHVTWSELASSAFGMARGLRDGIVSGAELIRAGGIEGAPTIGLSYSPLGYIPDIAVRGVPVVPVGTALRLPGRAVAAIHSFFRTANYSMEKAAVAFRTAANEGLTGADFDRRVAEIRQNPSEEVMEQARHGATELTLMGKGSEFVQAMSKLTNTNIFGFPYLKFVDPFVHIAGSIIDQSIVRRTPLGLLAPELRADVMGKNGPIAQDQAIGRMLVGTALGVTFGGLAAQGLASGSGPSDPKEAAMWRLAGNQAHSVRIGDFWYDTHRLGPLGMLGSVAADLYEVGHKIGKDDASDVAHAVMHAFTHTILDESFMRGPSDLIKALEDPDRYGGSYVRNFLSSFVPFSVGMAQVARRADPYSRQARTLMDAVKNKIPGLSQELFARRDIWGEPMLHLEGVGLTSIYASQISNDPVNRAMLDLGVYPAAVQRKIRNVDLTDEQYDDFSRIAGRMTKMRLDAIVRSPDYQTWPNHIRHDVIDETVRQSREAARGVVMMKYPKIIRDAADARIKEARGE